MARRAPNVTVFGYLDYRQYLRDWYADRKKNRRGFSLRSFSKDAGFNSPNFFKLIADGDRNLTVKSIIPFIKGLRLSKQEEDFFRNLVFFTQSDDPEEKGRLYERMIQSRKFSQIKPLEKEQYEFFSTWYHPVVRELMVSPHFDGTPEFLSARIQPPISVHEASKSMDLLKKLKIVRQTPEGRWEQADPLLTTGAELRSRALIKYHQELLESAKRRLTEVPPEKRDLSALTLGIEEGQIPLLKEKIQEFRRELLKLISTNPKTEQVVILTIQLFPFTQIPPAAGNSNP